MDNETQNVKNLKAMSAAFSDYLEQGIDFVKKFYPNQLDFVLENKDKNFDDVRNLITQQFRVITEH